MSKNKLSAVFSIAELLNDKNSLPDSFNVIRIMRENTPCSQIILFTSFPLLLQGMNSSDWDVGRRSFSYLHTGDTLSPKFLMKVARLLEKQTTSNRTDLKSVPFSSDGDHVAFPIDVAGSCIGLLIFTDTTSASWDQEDLEFILGTLNMLEHHYEITIEFNELKLVEDQIRKVLQDSPLSYQSLDEQGHILDVNQRWLDTLGYERDKVIGSWFGDYLTDKGREDFSKNFARFKAAGEIHDVIFQMRTTSGVFKTVIFNGMIRTDSEGKFIQTYCHFHDITETQRLHEEVSLNKAKYQALFDSNMSIMLLIDPEDGRILEANSAAINFYGYSHEELLELSIHEINTLPQEKLKDAMKSVIDFENTGFTFLHRCKNGEIKQVETFSSPIVLKGKTILYSIINDITQRLEMEQMIRQSQKMDAIGQLAAGIAHDFNNQLAAIMGYTELIQLENCSPKVNEYVEQALIGCNRSKQLIKQLLSYSRTAPVYKQPFNIHELIHEITTLLEHTISKTIIIREDLTAEHYILKGDSNQIHTVILNIMLNSRDAIEGNGVIEITTTNCQLMENKRSQLSIEAQTEDFLKLVIKDDGCGMNAQILKHIFDPFYTTKPEGKGSGMGLSAVWGIIKDHQGGISVESEEGQGSTFSMLIPILH